jgi:UDP-N-acetylmuramoyl-L-alanyl-D-glutamate--2,6-diaminopimelate ligase
MSKSVPNRDKSQGSAASRVIKLREFLREAVFVGARDIEVRRCTNRADRCRPGDIFVPAHDSRGDEADRAEEAVRRGAAAIVTERILPVSVPQCLVEDTRIVYGKLCQALAGNPSQRMLTIGVVGSHGKTTTSLFIASAMKKLAGAVAYYTSLGNSDSQVCDRSSTKAPGATKLGAWLERADSAGSPAAIIELTESMLCNQVTAGVEFDLIVVTGLRSSQFRGSQTSEQQTRLLNRLLENLKNHGVLLVNGDDASAVAFAEQTETPVAFYGLDAGKQIRGKRLQRYGGEQQILAIAGNMIMPMTLKIPGDHVARAALAAVATSWIVDMPIPETVAAVETLDTIPGRMQRVPQSIDVPVYVDQGQSPDRVAVALHALKSHNIGPTTVVMDLSPYVDSQWRHRLGEVLDKGAQSVVLSGSDLSPEATRKVAMDVLGGCRYPGRVQIIPDRQAAIEWAVANTAKGCILLSGCGSSSWINRTGEERCDEMVAKATVGKSNRAAAAVKLSVFPPIQPTEFFSH